MIIPTIQQQKEALKDPATIRHIKDLMIDSQEEHLTRRNKAK